MRKNLGSPADLNKLPSYLGHVFRSALNDGVDSFDYQSLHTVGAGEQQEAVKLRMEKAWAECRDAMGMHMPPDLSSTDRQQYVSWQ